MMTEYQMTHILAQAMDGEVGEALRQYLNEKFMRTLNEMIDMGKREAIDVLKMVRAIERDLDGMKNTLKMMSKE